MQWELQEQFQQSCKGNSSLSTRAFVRTVYEIEHHDIVCSVVFAIEFSDKRPCEWSNIALFALEAAIEEYMIEVFIITHPLLLNISTDW
jgi:hypothetical protein